MFDYRYMTPAQCNNFFLNCFIVRRVESRYENSRGGRTCSRDRFGYKRYMREV
jgi:hypothetical protein